MSLGPALQDMRSISTWAIFLPHCYDRGGKIVGTIQDRLGETAFMD